MPNNETLYTKYRPRDFDSVIGQDTIVQSLKAVIKSNNNHALLFHGPSGTGKTTLARICAYELGAEDRDILEIDAATFTGIDDMRKVTETLNYRLVGRSSVRPVIVDETHRLSPAAFSALLKPIEEPPSWVYWFLCTTELGKVPQNIKTRCTPYGLKPVPTSEIRELLTNIAKKERFNGKQIDSIIDLCSKEAHGSPRQALVNLGACASAASLDDAKELMKSAQDSAEAVDLAKLLSMGRGWLEVKECLADLKEKDSNAESVRMVVQAYVTAVIMGDKNPKPSLFAVLEAFSVPFPSGNGIAPLVLACGKLFFAND